MCRPISFCLTKNNKILYKSGISSHTGICNYFNINEDKVNKYKYIPNINLNLKFEVDSEVFKLTEENKKFLEKFKLDIENNLPKYILENLNENLMLQIAEKYIHKWSKWYKYIDINVKDQYGNTILDYASCDNHIKIAKLLFDKGININQKNGYGYTALHYANKYNNIEIVKLLENYK